MEKKEIVTKLLAAKDSSGMSYDELASKLGLCNMYVAQLFRRQAQLHDQAAINIKSLVPGLTDELLAEMKKPPLRSFDPNILQDPTVYRVYEVVGHYGDAIVAVIQEKFGDGIMSAIDFTFTIDKVKGSKGEDRVLMTMNGKYLAHVEQEK